MSETYRDQVKKAIDQAFAEKGLYIDWQLRDHVVDAIMTIYVPLTIRDDKG